MIKVENICCVEGCNEPIKTKGYCRKHYWQIWRHGKILDYTMYDRNVIIFCDNHAELIIKNKNGKEIMNVKIDKDDVEKISQYKWHKQAENYVGTTLPDGYVLLLHRLIMNTKEKEWVDHIDHDRFNCQKYNLRLCTGQENCINKGIQSNNTSGIPGVSFNKRKNKWRAYITIDRKQKHLGYFDDIEDAKTIRLEAEKKYFGEFAPNIRGNINEY